MRLLFVGAGATGGYFGGRLAQAGRDVTFLARPARAEQLRRDGLRIVSPHGDATLAPKLVEASALDASYDAVVLAVKAYSLDAALKDIAPAMGPATAILPLLNGMRHMEAIAAVFGADALIGSLCSIAATLDEEGRIVHFSPFHNFVYGEVSGGRSVRIERLDAVMQHAVFDARLSLSIEQDLWNKWMMLATLAGVTCLMRGSIGEIEEAPGGRDFVERFFGEVAAVGAAQGYAPSAAFLDETRALLTAKGSPLTSSMYRDLKKSGPIEADEIIGDLLARARRANLDTPLIAAAYAHLTIYQRQRVGGQT